MAGEYGLNLMGKTGRNVMCIADGDMSGFKIGGISLDLNTVPSNQTGAPLVLTDDTTVPVGAQYMRFGQVLTKITALSSATITSTATGGTFTVSVNANGNVQTTAAQAYNVATATLQTAIQGLSNVGAGNATVTGTAGTSYVISFTSAVANPVTVTVGAGSLTGGTATVATTSDSDVGFFGPFDPAANDGRQTLTRGSVFILNRTWLAAPLGTNFLGGSGLGTLHPAVFDKGLVWKPRIIATTGSHSLANGPTFTELEAAMPSLRYIDQ